MRSAIIVSRTLLRYLAIVVALAAGYAVLAPVHAAPAVIETDHIRAELVARASTVAPGDVAEILIDHTLEPGWHTYWLNPGDSGEPPIFEWTLPEGASAQALKFPTPQRIAYPPLMNHGYKDSFALLASVRIPDDWPTGKPFPVTVRADWLVCEAICIPEGGKASFAIETGPQTVADSTVAFRFVKAEWELPHEPAAPARYERDGDTIRLSSPVGSADNALFFALDRDALSHTAEHTAVATDDGVILSMAAGRGRLDGTLEGVLTSADGSFWIRATGPVDPVPVASAAPPAAQPLPSLSALAPPPPSSGLPQTLLFAFLGGLLLNLMPCVFPVLALKALGLIQHADAPLVRRSAIAGGYTAGVLVTFAVLCGALLALKSGGAAVGWGFQLQSPAFVAAMVVLLFAIGLNLSGVYQIGTSLTRLGGRGPRDGVAGSFATGALAAIVATPCTAPFMAVAVGTALASSTATAAAVFAALALGLAMPFALLCLVPGLARILPKPGVWMERLKQVLAFPLYATAAWLLWVLVQLSGPDAVLSAGVALVLVALGAWLFGLSQRGSAPSHKVATGLAALSLIAALFALTPAITPSAPTPVARASAADRAEPFTPQRLSDLRAEGEPVFVNVTAAWCITCKVNEQVVFASNAFEELLAERGVTYLEADWTRRDPDVTRLLDDFGRAGVPLYAFFPANGAPVVLPQILTLSKLSAAFAS